MAPAEFDRERDLERVILERCFVTSSADATERLAESLGAHLTPGSVLALQGDLGSGKTCFVRGLARGLGVADLVTSPTFTLMHEYQGRIPLYHLDAWMQGRGEAFLEDGGAEWLSAGGVAAVEWAERVGAWLPLPRILARFEHRGADRRRIALSVLGAAASARASDELGDELGASLAGAVRALAPGADVAEEPSGS